ncbi:hypothetical protein MLD38_040590 [Melastoma candidum]|nr:hypothetical protein MLD38_040590 [Melastoma candidum]
MGSRIQSHQLSNGLLVSGRGPEQPKERLPTMAARAVPYTGGDVKKSGELGKMFDISLGDGPPPLKHSRPSSSSQHNSGSFRSGQHSGQVSRPNSGQVRKTSGPLTPLAPTGLITSGPASGPVGPSGRRSGQLDGTGALAKTVYGSAVTNLSGEGVKVGCRVSKGVMWVAVVVVAMGVVVGAFLMAAVKKAVILVVVAAVIGPVLLVFGWNYCWRRKGLLEYVKRHPDTELRGAVDGQYVKVSGVVTCGSIPLESSYKKVQRCVYVSTELYEYRGCRGKTAHPKRRFFSWGRRYSEKYVADFYISDFQSGLRALVKAGYGAKFAPFVKPATVVDVTKDNKELSPSFLQWLLQRNLSSDDRIMRLKEGYIKEGSTVSVMGIVRRQDNVLMVVPPTEPVSTGCQWLRGFLPTYVEGIIVTCEDSRDDEVVNV